jgi:hypothetical protein
VTRSLLRGLRRAAALFALLFLLPLGLHALWLLPQDRAESWSRADWSSAGLVPAAGDAPEAVVLVYAARAGRWRGVFAHHAWIVTKAEGEDRYVRYDKVGWGRPIRTNGWAPDARWYGEAPELVGAVRGEAAKALIPKIRAAVESYPFSGSGAYAPWPGPNSNTFVNHVLAAVPEAGIVLPPTALGKDYRTDGRLLGPAPSGTGVQLAVMGLAGVTLAAAEGLEINLLGLVVGVDLRRPAIKLPGFGRIGTASAETDAAFTGPAGAARAAERR